MKSILLDFPKEESLDALPEWLDWHLVTPGLDQLVAELAAIHGKPARTITLESLLAGHRDSILEAGLRELPRDLLSNLLRQPALLLELRDLVFAEGGAYWDRIDPEEIDPKRIKHIIDRVNEKLESEPTTTTAATRSPRVAFYRHPAFVGFATAAAVLLGVYLVGGPSRPGGTGTGPDLAQGSGVSWGWASEGGLPTAGNDAATFAHLRTKAKQWFDKRPDTPQALAQRIGEFRQGCAALQLADNLPLSEKEKGELLKRCIKWSAEFDQLLAKLEAKRDVPGIRDEADKLVNRLADFLESREKAARGA